MGFFSKKETAPQTPRHALSETVTCFFNSVAPAVDQQPLLDLVGQKPPVVKKNSPLQEETPAQGHLPVVPQGIDKIIEIRIREWMSRRQKEEAAAKKTRDDKLFRERPFGKKNTPQRK
jgi:hypothetical protein